MKNRILITLLFIGMEARASQTFQSLEAAARAKQAKLAESLAETAEGEAQKLITEARELLQSSQHMSGISLDKKERANLQAWHRSWQNSEMKLLNLV